MVPTPESNTEAFARVENVVEQLDGRVQMLEERISRLDGTVGGSVGTLSVNSVS